MKAIKDIHSSFNPKTIYAKANEPLKLINNRDGVLIVENENGNRFSATQDEVTRDEKLTLDVVSSITTAPIITNRVSVQRTKAKPINQTELF